MADYSEFIIDVSFYRLKDNPIFILNLFPHYFAKHLQKLDACMNKWTMEQDKFDSCEYIYLIPLRMIDEFSLPKKELSEQFFVKNLVQLKN